MVNARKHKNLDWGIEGYDFPKFNPHTNKPRIVTIHEGKKKTFIDEVVKTKNFIPPADYNIMGSLVNPKRFSSMPKGRRITMPMAIEILN